jgi:hypothetical protein
MAIDAFLQVVTEIVLNVWTRKHKAWRRLAWIVLLAVLAATVVSTLGK